QFLDNICAHPILYASQAVAQFLQLLPSNALSQSIECMSVSLRNLRGWCVQEDWLDCGWRATKQFYLVKPTDGRKTRRDILSWTSYGPDWSMTPEATRELLDFVAKLECPYIQQPLFSWCDDLGALTVRRLIPEGTLRDHFYKGKPCDPYMKKYNFNCEVFTLQTEDARHIGRHILEALRYLNSIGIPYGK
uniref:Uncharacterized protein n=1 Tax=Plectus sambesii TaxID=2011161 RepID=A0A914VAM7_9BILA